LETHLVSLGVAVSPIWSSSIAVLRRTRSSRSVLNLRLRGRPGEHRQCSFCV
jgi:hypothetical protein